MTSPRSDADATDGPVLAVRGVHRTYAAETVPVRALRGIDLTVHRGEFVALTGPSGVGKTTLLEVIAGLGTADEGTVHVAGTEMTALDEAGRARLRRRHIGIVFQSFALLDGATAQENVAMAALIAGAERRRADERARELLDLLGLLDRADAVPTVLSGGQRQRLAIARALVNEPTLLLADEPTGSLDSAGGAAILELFGRLHAAGRTIVLVTHDPQVAAAASRHEHLLDGRLVEVAR